MLLSGLLLLFTSGLLKDTNALSVGETHPSDRRESDASGAIWDYIVVSGNLFSLLFFPFTPFH